MAKAYVVGELLRNSSTGRLELVDIDVKSSPAMGLTCMDGRYWCDFGAAFEESSFDKAAQVAEKHAAAMRSWLRLGGVP